MTTTRLEFHFVKSAALIFNGVFVPISLYTGILMWANMLPLGTKS